MMTKYVFFILNLLLFSSCQDINELKYIVKWYGREMKIPNLEIKISEKETYYQKKIKKKYNIFVYIDSTDCLPCHLRLYDWRLFIDRIAKKTEQVGFIFVINGKFKEFETYRRNDKFNYPVFYDRKNIVKKLNKLSSQSKYNTFLLDSSNKVLLIGRPFESFKMYKMYEDILLSK